MKDADIFAACKTRWLTAREIARPGIKHVDRLLPRLYVLHGSGFLRMRPRKHEPDEDGNKPPGPPPAEFRVHTDWGGLEQPTTETRPARCRAIQSAAQQPEGG